MLAIFSTASAKWAFCTLSGTIRDAGSSAAKNVHIILFFLVRHAKIAKKRRTLLTLSTLFAESDRKHHTLHNAIGLR